MARKRSDYKTEGATSDLRSPDRGARPDHASSVDGARAEQFRMKGNHVASRDTPPEPPSSTCPECGTEMVVARVKPLLFGGKFEDLTLACKACGFTKDIRIERS